MNSVFPANSRWRKYPNIIYRSRGQLWTMPYACIIISLHIHNSVFCTSAAARKKIQKPLNIHKYRICNLEMDDPSKAPPAAIYMTLESFIVLKSNQKAAPTHTRTHARTHARTHTHTHTPRPTRWSLNLNTVRPAQALQDREYTQNVIFSVMFVVLPRVYSNWRYMLFFVYLIMQIKSQCISRSATTQSFLFALLDKRKHVTSTVIFWIGVRARRPYVGLGKPSAQ